MKKPNTEIFIHCEEEFALVEVNGKYLSAKQQLFAYDKMIDALIAVELEERNSNILTPEVSNKVLKALEKAGCTDD